MSLRKSFMSECRKRINIKVYLNFLVYASTANLQQKKKNKFNSAQLNTSDLTCSLSKKCNRRLWYFNWYYFRQTRLKRWATCCPGRHFALHFDDRAYIRDEQTTYLWWNICYKSITRRVHSFPIALLRSFLSSLKFGNQPLGIEVIRFNLLVFICFNQQKMNKLLFLCNRIREFQCLI